MDLSKTGGLYRSELEHDACGVGVVANIKGVPSHDIVEKAVEVLSNLGHRGAPGADPESGDGAGILIQIPHEFFVSECDNLGLSLPLPGEYGVGMIFMPRDPATKELMKNLVDRLVVDEGQTVIGWRDVPVDASAIAITATIGFKIIGFVDSPTSTVGDAFTDVLVKFNPSSHAYLAGLGI